MQIALRGTPSATPADWNTKRFILDNHNEPESDHYRTNDDQCLYKNSSVFLYP